MIQLNNHLNPQLREQLDDFIKSIQERTGDHLRSLVLYGGYAKNDFTEGKSNVNLLMIFDKVDLGVLDSISIPVQKGMSGFRLSPFILTSGEVSPSADVFAVKLFDIRQHHVLLYGEDLLSGLVFDNKHLRFISEQEVRNQLARMKFFYLQNFNVPEALLKKVLSGITTLLINANTLLFLKRGIYLSTRTEIISHLLKEKEMDEASLGKLLKLKEKWTEATTEQVREAYDLLMIEFNQLIKAFKTI